MQITDVKVFTTGMEVSPEQKLKAYVSITFDDSFVVRGLKIIDGYNGLFVVMPSRKLVDGTFKDIAHPLDNETRQYISGVVLKKFNETNREPGNKAQ